LYKHQKNHAINAEGMCPGLYGYFIDDLMSEYKVNSPHDIPFSEQLVQYIFDELKMAAGIVTNSQTCKTVGFTALNHGKLLNLMLEEEDLVNMWNFTGSLNRKPKM
jgi:hypothetical protein